MRIAKKYPIIGLGGTFDHFHEGHKKFIRHAAAHGKMLKIGITHPKMTHHKAYSESIDSFRHRSKNVQKFCKSEGISCQLSQISDLYGPTLEKKSVQALCVTQETVAGAEKINQARTAAGFRELPVFICEMYTDELGQPLHAEAIRSGSVSRTGIVYDQILKNDLELSEHQKQFFKKPLGTLLDNDDDPTIKKTNRVYVVGDVTLKRWQENSWPFSLAIYDGQTQRQATEVISSRTPPLTVKNPAGVISSDLVRSLHKAINTQHPLVAVTGEEDLATAALILLAPLSTKIYYGQPNQGLVEVIVTEKLKNTIHDLLSTN